MVRQVFEWRESVYNTFQLNIWKNNFLKIADANSIFADVKSIIQLSRRHFFADVK